MDALNRDRSLRWRLPRSAKDKVSVLDKLIKPTAKQLEKPLARESLEGARLDLATHVSDLLRARLGLRDGGHLIALEREAREVHLRRVVRSLHVDTKTARVADPPESCLLFWLEAEFLCTSSSSSTTQGPS